MQLNISQAATLLSTSEGMLTRWARQGAIPSIEIDAAYYFEEKALMQWASRRRIPLRKLEDFVENPLSHSPSILDAMFLGGFCYDVEGCDAPSLLSALINEIDIVGVDKQVLLKRVLEREELSSTGIGNGIAIPHPRQPIETLDTSAVITCFPKHPVDFCAIDRKAVSVVFLVLSVNTQLHLKLLSQLSFILHQPSNSTFFCSAPTAEDIMQRVAQYSAQLVG